MPIEEGLIVKFIGDDGNLTKSIQDIEAELLRLNKQLKTTTNGKEFDILTKQVKEYEKGLRNLRSGQDPFKKVTAGSNEATQSLINLSRVAQDAPYGFIGIANNLNPLLESFQRLKTETGSTKTAFASLASSMAGPAGIGLALGVVSSLLVTFGDKLFGSKSAADEFKDKMDDLNRSLEETNKQISEVVSNLGFQDQVFAINNKTLGIGSLTQFRQELYATNSALGDVQPKIDELFKRRNNLSVDLETAPTRGLGQKEIDELKQEFDAVSKAYETASNQQTSLVNRQTLLEAKIRLQKVEDQKDADDKAEAQRKKDLVNQKKYLEELRRLAEQEAELQRQLYILRLNASKIPDELDSEKPNLNTDNSGLIGFFVRGHERMKEEMSGITATSLAEGEKQFQEWKKQMAEMQAKAADLAATISGALAPAFSSLFSTIVQGGNPLKAFFQSLGQAITQLIGKLIAAAIQAAILNALLPGGAAIGGNMVKGFSNIFKGLLGFAQGAVVSGPVMAMVGEGRGTSRSNPEIVAPLDKLKQFIGSNQVAPSERLVTELSGDTLRLWIKRSNDSGRMFS